LSNIIKSSRLVEVEPVNYISKDVSIDNKELEKIFEDTIKRAKEEHELIISDAKDESKKIIEKAEIKYEEMINTAKAVMIVTHSMSFVQKVCNKAIWLQKGQIRYIGSPEEAIALYQADIQRQVAARSAQQS